MRAGGLEGVVVAETELSHVDGEGGRLVIRGHDLEALAGRISYESMCWLLWEGGPPQSKAAKRPRSEPKANEGGPLQEVSLGAARSQAFGRVASLGDALAARDGMAALRSALSHLSSAGEAGSPSFDTITGAVAVFAAAWARRRAGRLPIPPWALCPRLPPARKPAGTERDRACDARDRTEA